MFAIRLLFVFAMGILGMLVGAAFWLVAFALDMILGTFYLGVAIVKHIKYVRSQK